MRFAAAPKGLGFVNPTVEKKMINFKSKDPYNLMKAKDVKPSDSNKARTLIFNVFDINMDAALSIKELFKMIKLGKVFTFLAGEDYKSAP